MAGTGAFASELDEATKKSHVEHEWKPRMANGVDCGEWGSGALQLGAGSDRISNCRALLSLLDKLDTRIWGSRKKRGRGSRKVGQGVPLMYSLYFTSYAPSS